MDETKKIKAADDIIFEKAGITIEKGGKKMNSIFHRVSIRKYTDQKIEEEKIMQMLRAAMGGAFGLQSAAMGVLCGDESGEDKRIVAGIAVHGMRQRCTARICTVLSGNGGSSWILSD